MTILGWVLIVLGIVSYLIALAMLVKEQFFSEGKKGLGNFTSADLEQIGKLLEQLGNLFEKFSKLSVPVQWAFIGLVQIGIGAYLLNLP